MWASQSRKGKFAPVASMSIHGGYLIVLVRNAKQLIHCLQNYNTLPPNTQIAMSVWYPVIELTNDKRGNANYEACEAYSDTLQSDARVVMVESGEDAGKAFIEREFGDGGGGWVKVGYEANPDDDLFEVADDIINGMDKNGVRYVFDYSENRYALEEWVEPE